MKKTLLLTLTLTLLFLLCLTASAQVSTATARRVVTGSGAPPSTCAEGSVYGRLGTGLYYCSPANTWTLIGGSGGSGTVTDVSVVTANGVSGSVATSTTTPAITLTLGAITPTSVRTASVFGGTAANSTLTLKSTSGVGTSDAIIFQVGNNGATEAMRIYTDGKVGIGLGSTSSPTMFTVGDTSSSTPRGLMSWQASTDTASAHLAMRKSRGTFASPTTVATADVLGRLVYSGYDGSSYIESAYIRALATGTVASTRVPTKLEFYTGTDAAPTVATLALTLGADQSATFAGALSGTTANFSGAITVASCTGCGGGGGITVGSTTITSGVSGSVPYNNAGVYGETNLTYASNALTQTQTSLGASRADGLVLTNTTAAAAGTTQLSQSLRFSSQGWKTTSTAASRTVEVSLDLRPIEQTTNPAYGLQISTQCASCTTGTSFSQHSVFGVAVDGTQYAWFPGGAESSTNWAGIALGLNFGTQASPSVSGLYQNSGGSWFIVKPVNNFGVHGSFGLALTSGGLFQWSNNSSSLPTGTVDTFIGRQAAASIRLGAADLNGTPVAQTLRVQNAITGTDKAPGASFTVVGPLGTGNTTPGYVTIQGGARNTASGTTAHTAIDRQVIGATKVLTNNTATAIVNVTDASNTTAAGTVDYAIEVFDGTDIQVESGTFTYQVTNKGGTIANNTITAPTGFPKNVATSGTLTATWTITAANPAVLTLNANSSLTPSTGYPRLTYTIRNLTNQAIAIQ